MNPEFAALIAGCLAAPDDLAPRLILADWCEEQGFAESAVLAWRSGVQAIRVARQQPTAILTALERSGIPCGVNARVQIQRKLKQARLDGRNWLHWHTNIVVAWD